MRRDSDLYLEDILYSIQQIEEYTKNLSETQFRNDIAIQDAIIRRFEIIGEATKNIPSDFKKDYPKVPWKEIAGMRDVLSHAYFEVDLKRIWKTVKEDLPKFKKQLKSLPKL